MIRQTIEFSTAFTEWFKAIAITTFKIVVLVNLLLILQKILNEFGIIEWILKPFIPLLRIMGLPANTGFLWMIAYTLGLSYGGAIMINQSEEGRLSRAEADLLNHHIAISHSQLEDTLLFAAMGYNILILVFPRILLSILYVWVRRLELYFRK
jgi:spore maturation protein SpmB